MKKKILYYLAFYFLICCLYACFYYLFPDFFCFKDGSLSFIESLYFSVVTITTLGYGDISPTKEYGMLVVSTEPIFGLVMMGWFINALWKDYTDKINENGINNFSLYLLKKGIDERKDIIYFMTTPYRKRLEERRKKEKEQEKNIDPNFTTDDFKESIIKHSFDSKYFNKILLQEYFTDSEEKTKDFMYILGINPNNKILLEKLNPLLKHYDSPDFSFNRECILKKIKDLYEKNNYNQMKVTKDIDIFIDLKKLINIEIDLLNELREFK